MEDDAGPSLRSEAPGRETEAPLPSGVALLGLAMALSAALPLTPEGTSFIKLVLAEFRNGAMEGIVMLAGFGSPFVFGLAVFCGHLFFDAPTAKRLVRVPVSLLHSQLVLVAFVLWRNGSGVAPIALLGLGVVGAAHLVLHTARTHAEGPGPTLVWYTRWGATMIAAVAVWARLQRVAGVQLGIAVDALLICSLLVVFVIERKRRVLAAVARRRQEPRADDD